MFMRVYVHEGVSMFMRGEYVNEGVSMFMRVLVCS